MKLAFLIGLLMMTNLGYTSETVESGGIKNKRTGKEIKLVCTNEHCDYFQFLEYSKKNDKNPKALSNKIFSVSELLDVFEAKLVKSTNSRKPRYLNATKTVGNALMQDANIIGAALFFFVVALPTMTAETTGDLVHHSIAGTQNAFKKAKLRRFINDQVRGNGDKTFKLNNKNYTKLLNVVKSL